MYIVRLVALMPNSLYSETAEAYIHTLCFWINSRSTKCASFNLELTTCLMSSWSQDSTLINVNGGHLATKAIGHTHIWIGWNWIVFLFRFIEFKSSFFRKRIVSGVQPTGSIHLGNYLGAIRNWISLQVAPNFLLYKQLMVSHIFRW